MDNVEKPKDVTPDQITALVNAFLQYQEVRSKNDEKKDKQAFDLEKRRIEAERQTEKWNKFLGAFFTLGGLIVYTIMTWHNKMTEGLGIFITAIVTASLSGVFKHLIGKKKDEHSDGEEE